MLPCLTGALRVLAAEGVRQEAVPLKDPAEMIGINTLEDLWQAEQIIGGRR